MKQVQSADFRKGFAAETEPVQVMKYKQVLGTWVPGGMNPVALLGTITVEPEMLGVSPTTVLEKDREIEALQAEVKELKRLLALRDIPDAHLAPPPGFGRSSAVPKPGSKKGK